MTFMLNYLKDFTFNLVVHSINTRKNLQLHWMIENLESFQKHLYYASIKIFYKLLEFIIELIKDMNYYVSTL
jgi:hypothetical protein